MMQIQNEKKKNINGIIFFSKLIFMFLCLVCNYVLIAKIAPVLMKTG